MAFLENILRFRFEGRNLQVSREILVSIVLLLTLFIGIGELYSKYKFPASRIFNLDETGLTNVQTKCQRVLSPKGVKQLGATTSQERGKLVTMVGTINAMGGFIPAFLISPRARFVERLLDGAPPTDCWNSKWQAWKCLDEKGSVFAVFGALCIA